MIFDCIYLIINDIKDNDNEIVFFIHVSTNLCNESNPNGGN